MTDRIVSVPELAEHYGISQGHVYNLLHRGLPSIKAGRCRRFRLSEVDEYFKQHAA